MLEYGECGGTDLEHTVKRNQKGDVKRYFPKGFTRERQQQKLNAVVTWFHKGNPVQFVANGSVV